MQQAHDFLAESDALYNLLEDQEPSSLDLKTGFKNWTGNDIIRHLHFWNLMAGYQITDEAKLMAAFAAFKGPGSDMREKERAQLGDVAGSELLELWITNARALSPIYAAADPKQRVKWVGPSMSARSSITARQMETWAHGQALFDVLAIERKDTDRIKNIVVMGVNTYGWTYKARREDIPGPMPYLKLSAPSGDVWTFGNEQSDEVISGPAVDFCQTVTQTRNVRDTRLVMHGAISKDWMSKAQCFAGAAHAPPEPGARVKASKAPPV